MIDKLVHMNRHLRIVILYFCFLLSFLTCFLADNAWFILLSFFFIGLLIYTSSEHSKRYVEILEASLGKFLKQNDFTADTSYLSDDYLSGMAINESESRIAIVFRKNINEKFKMKLFDFKDIIDCSISEDGETLTKVSKGGLIGSSIVGSVVAGSAGMIVGGLSANKHSSEQIFKATLSIIIDDLSSPVYNIDFLKSNMMVSKNSDLYQGIQSDMQRWYRRIGIIIKRNEELNKQSVYGSVSQ